MQFLFYILLVLIPVTLFIISNKVYDLKFRGEYLPHVKKLLLFSQIPLYLLILLSLIGYPLTIKFSLLGIYVVVNQLLNYKAHLHNKKLKEDFIEHSKEELKKNPLINQL